MRRTYKSKKDAGGVLEYKEMLFNMDEKSSVFDAFYIQNIKQTKRELSHMGSSNNYVAASNRVRKRKYVKRIIKEAEPPPLNSLTTSVLLTPDKSLRVNKAEDLFDQLLNSSPVWPEAKQSKKEDLFGQILANTQKVTRKYNRRKEAPKKVSFSSSDDTDSEKENTCKNWSSIQNATDIKSHELVIEKEAGPMRKNDDSIHKIVQKLSLINNVNKSSDGSAKKAYKCCYKNRLTKNFQSPAASKNSPLSSTPFATKMRSKSIYKFSPIPIGKMDHSPNVTIVEDDEEVNKSIIFIPKNSSHSFKTSQNKDISSPLTHLVSADSWKPKGNSKSLFSSEEDSKENLDNKHQVANDSNNAAKTKSKENTQETNTQISSLQVSEIEPFLGFSAVSESKSPNDSLENNKEDSIIISTGKHSKNSLKSKENSKTSTCSTNSTISHEDQSLNFVSIIEHTEPSEPFLGFRKENETSQIQNKIIEQDEVVNHDTIMYEMAIPSRAFLGVCEVPFSNDDNLEDDNDDISTSTDSQSDQSVYDTCDSESSSTTDNMIEPVVAIEKMDTELFNKYYNKMPTFDDTDDSERISNTEKKTEPIVAIERMDAELFKNYYNKISESSDNDDPILSDDDEYISYNSSDNTQEDTEKSESDVDYSSNESEGTSSNDDTYMDDKEITISECNKNDDEDRGVNFVTTRRRNDFTNNSTIFILDDSQDSSHSELDTTAVLKTDAGSAICKIEENSLNEEILDRNTSIISKDNLITKKDISPDTRFPNVSVRGSAACRNSTSYQDLDVSKDVEVKPLIVLQSGKKWERSLSIYRRMTTMNDHFDHSMLEDKDLECKGRKYRQSVISTMEMQPKGSLHNDSINSRRSTFISKPSRSTIRIVKETNNSRISLSSTTVFDDFKGFLEDCDDTIIDLSKLSLSDDHEVTVIEKLHESSRLSTARDYVLRRCNQSDTLPFDECYADSLLKNCRKIGEGVYGEVYLWRAPDGRARVMKIVPIAGETRVNGERQKDFHEIIAEIVIAMELSALRAPIAEIECHYQEGKDIEQLDLHSVQNATDVFNEVLAVRCVYGGYPSRLLDLWDLYDESKGSENDNPAILPRDQQYIVLELANAGQDLESYQFNSAEQAYALFLQVAFGLAVGEEAFQFEHRDLHWGNVLIAPTDQKFATFVLRGRPYRILRRGVAATIIDYSLSRVALPGAGSSAALYNDLAHDDVLFAASGDYQFEVYRLMRDRLRNEWESFEPFTNVLWLHYTADKMLTALRYKRTTSKTHAAYLSKLANLKSRLLSYDSATQFVLTDNQY